MTIRKVLLILFGFVAGGLPLLAARVTVTHLRCEYRADPAGIGELHPRLGWILQAEAGARGVRQTAYQIIVAASPEVLAQGVGNLWDTGKVNSDQMQHLVYAGRTLGSRQQCWWKARVWDEAGGESAWSVPAYWSMGLLAAEDWRAQWIGLDAVRPADGSTLDDGARERLARQPWAYADLEVSKTAPLTAYVRGTLACPTGRQLVRAALVLTADQVCAITVNSRPAGAVTRWEQIAPIDVTSLLAPGDNVIGLAITQRDGYQPAALGEVQLQFADGGAQIVAIDTGWKFATTAGTGWAERGYDDHEWKPLIAPPRKRVPWDGPPQTLTYWLSPAPLLRKSFAVAKPVRRATVFSTALGAYELQLNGTRVGRDYFTPGWTDFRARVQYQTYDVTAQVHRGENALGAILGDGWYASVLGYTGQRYYYGGYPRLLAQLEIEYADGTREIVASDGTWRAAWGAIRHADLMQGCEYDARLRRDGWAQAGYDDAAWQLVATGLRPLDPQQPLAKFVLEAANAEPTRVAEERPARTVAEPRPGAYTFDLGQNMVGWVRLKVRGRPGQKIMVRHGEMLNPNGTLYTSNLRGASATDVYYLRGGEAERLEPYFTFHGFRYVEVTGLETPPGPEAVTGVVVHSDLARTGEFACSSPLVNQLFQNIIWGQKGNYLEVPTDCPQRDERAGWSGDAQLFVRTGAYNFDIAAFFSRWLTTLALDSQLPDGSFANVAPAFGRLWTATGWSDATLLCTHALYRVYGDTRIIERNFAAMSRYMVWLGSKPASGAVVKRPLGDHLNLGGGATVAVIDTAYHAYLCGLMAEMAAAIGRPDEAARYAEQREQGKAAFQRDFVLADGSIRDSSQTGYALAFSMDLLPDEARPRVAAKFVEEMRKRDWHLATGFVGTPRLLPALHLAGRDDIAYRVLLQETYPSWLFPVKNGATTVWERWDGWTPDRGFQTISMNSFNHYSFGSVAEYLYRYVAGIDTDAPGFRSMVIQPSVAAGLTWVQARYDSIAGRVSSAWKVEGRSFQLEVEVPANTQATIFVPAQDADSVREGDGRATRARGVSLLRFDNGTAVFRVGSGVYHFTSTMAAPIE
jgi:alpha-L-rhamnosidase